MADPQGHKHDPKETRSFKIVASTTFRHRCCLLRCSVGWCRDKMGPCRNSTLCKGSGEGEVAGHTSGTNAIDMCNLV